MIAVGQLLREVIITLAQDQSLGPDDRADLHRIALRRLTPTPALQQHLPAPVDPRLRDVAAILADDPAADPTLAELGRAAGASERTLSRPLTVSRPPRNQAGTYTAPETRTARFAASPPSVIRRR
jgi:hypothetical protein